MSGIPGQVRPWSSESVKAWIGVLPALPIRHWHLPLSGLGPPPLHVPTCPLSTYYGRLVCMGLYAWAAGTGSTAPVTHFHSNQWML